MTYQAIITPVVNIREHPNADRIRCGTCCGYQVIIDLTTKEGELGIFFPTDGKLSHDFLTNNNLYRHTHLNINPEKGGFFEDNGRVRCQKFRGEPSEGFWVPLEALAWTGIDLSTLKKGYLFNDIAGYKICEKYYTPATIKAMRRNKMKGGHKRRLKEQYPYFKEHFETEQLRFFAETIPEGAICWITSKIHGTSGRTGYIQKFPSNNWWSRLWHKLLGRKEYDWEYITGTRKVTLDPDAVIDKGYYSNKKFRILVHEMFKDITLSRGLTVFYEIAGYDETGHFIQEQKIKDSALQKQWGSRIVYSYGCNPELPDRCFKVFVYRITTTDIEGRPTELSWWQVEHFCYKMGLRTVPVLHGPFIYDGDPQNLQLLCHTFAETQPDPLDPAHPHEGICLRVEHPRMFSIYKMKSFLFSELESIAKQYDEFTDIEEIS